MDAYNADVREACKYGSKCYQTNPAHTDRFKHPPKTEGKFSKLHIEFLNKKFWINNPVFREKRGYNCDNGLKIS